MYQALSLSALQVTKLGWGLDMKLVKYSN